jgi:protein-tyrosine phosphatase
MAVVGELHVSFVCTGNICRSPMAEKMFAVHLYREGLADRVRVSSAGTDGWHAGQDADARTNATLRRHGYPTGHVAAKFGNQHRDADLLVSLDSGHERRLAMLGIPTDRRRLLRSFDPNADSLDVPDPYYGDTADFDLVHDQIAAAIPGLLDWVRATLAANGASRRDEGADPFGDDARTRIAAPGDEPSTARGADPTEREPDRTVSYGHASDGRP